MTDSALSYPLLDELLAAPRWESPEWRSNMHRALSTGVLNRCRWRDMAAAVGDFHAAGEFERALVKGVRRLDAYWLTPGGVDCQTCDAAVFEVPQGREIKVERRIDDYEDPGRLVQIIEDVAAEIDRKVRGAIRELLDAAGFDLGDTPLDEWESLWPVAPFRVQIAQWDGMRSKEWLEDDGFWNFWISFRIGGAAFPASVS